MSDPNKSPKQIIKKKLRFREINVTLNNEIANALKRKNIKPKKGTVTDKSEIYISPKLFNPDSSLNESKNSQTPKFSNLLEKGNHFLSSPINSSFNENIPEFSRLTSTPFQPKQIDFSNFTPSSSSYNKTNYYSAENSPSSSEISELTPIIQIKTNSNSQLEDIESPSIKNTFQKSRSLDASIESINSTLEKLHFSDKEVDSFLNNINLRNNSNKNSSNSSKMTTPTFDYANFHRIIPEFSGETKQLNRFLACCENYNETLSETLKPVFLKSLVRKFTDRAFDFYNKKSWADWDELKTALKKYFSSSQSFEGYQLELGRIKQESLSVREFGEKIEFILNEINKISSEIKVGNASGSQFFKIQNEKLAIKSFINGLNEPLKTILRSRSFTTIQTAISDAIELEIEEKLESLHQVKTSVIKPKEISVKPTSNIISDNKIQNANLNSINCHKCSQFGHYANKCWLPRGVYQNNTRSPNNFNRNFSFRNGNQNNFQSNRNQNSFAQNNNYNRNGFNQESYFNRNQNVQNQNSQNQSNNSRFNNYNGVQQDRFNNGNPNFNRNNNANGSRNGNNFPQMQNRNQNNRNTTIQAAYAQKNDESQAVNQDNAAVDFLLV